MNGDAGSLDAEVRGLLATRGIDVGDDGAIDGIVTEVIERREREYLDGHAEPLAEHEVVALRRRVVGFGALTPLLDDPSIEEIWINRPDRVFVARGGIAELTNVILTAPELEHTVDRMLARAGRRLDRAQPFVDARLPDGSRLHVVAPPVTEHWSVNIRKFTGLAANRLGDLVAAGSLSPAAARFLEAAVVAGLSIVVAGAVGAGKTTLLGCLGSAIPSRERIVTCEEVLELCIAHPDVVAMQCRQESLDGVGEITLRDLVRESLRMRPDRIVVGEVRGAETLDMLLALNSGSVGMTSVHANSARDAVRKLTTLPLLAGGNLDRRFIATTVSACVDLVVFCERRTGRRRITEIASIGDQLGDGEPTIGRIFADDGERLHWTGELPPRPERFAPVGRDLAEILA